MEIISPTNRVLIFLSLFATIFLSCNNTIASEISGTIGTSTIEAVATPTPTPPPTTGGGGGGGGSGSSISKNVGKADMNNDGKVNIFDFVILMANWGKTGSNISADANNDNRVDILDFVLLMANWSNK